MKLFAATDGIPVEVYARLCESCWAWVDDAHTVKHNRWHRSRGDA